ncbi:MAG: alkaline phosphatase family protein [Acetobacteraceae bacterium]
MPEGRRNVLFIVLDQWRAEALGAAGNGRIRTPHLDRLAAEGTLFRNHFGQAAPCGPARAALLTGLYQHNNHVLLNGSPLDAAISNVAKEARRKGYDPVLFGYTDSTPDPRGLDPADPQLATYEGLMPGFTPELLLREDSLPWLAHLEAEGYAFANLAEALAPVADAPLKARFASRRSRTNFLTDAVLRFLSVRRQERWFVHLCYISPHPPFVVPDPFHALYQPRAMPPRIAAADPKREGSQHPLLQALLERTRQESFFAGSGPVALLDDAQFARLRATYYGMVSEVDEAIGRLIERLDAWGLGEETLIVVTADHGEMLGDHWLLGKDGYFAAARHVPLIVRTPGAPGGFDVTHFTEAVDVMPTILEWIGAAPPPRSDGASLLGFCTGEQPARWRKAAHWEGDFRAPGPGSIGAELGLRPSECGFAVRRDARFQYVHFAGLPPLLFDLAADPGCFTNLAGRADYAVAERDASQALLTWRMATSSGPLEHLLARPGGMVEIAA